MVEVLRSKFSEPAIYSVWHTWPSRPDQYHGFYGTYREAQTYANSLEKSFGAAGVRFSGRNLNDDPVAIAAWINEEIGNAASS